MALPVALEIQRIADSLCRSTWIKIIIIIIIIINSFPYTLLCSLYPLKNNWMHSAITGKLLLIYSTISTYMSYNKFNKKSIISGFFKCYLLVINLKHFGQILKHLGPNFIDSRFLQKLEQFWCKSLRFRSKSLKFP